MKKNCSKSNDAIIYGYINENLFQRKTSDIGLFEFSSNYNRCCNCNHDWTIIRYVGTNLCTIGNTWIFSTKYFIKKSSKRYRHPSSSIVTCSWTFIINSISTGVAVHGLFPNYSRANNCKLQITYVSSLLILSLKDEFVFGVSTSMRCIDWFYDYNAICESMTILNTRIKIV